MANIKGGQGHQLGSPCHVHDNVAILLDYTRHNAMHGVIGVGVSHHRMNVQTPSLGCLFKPLGSLFMSWAHHQHDRDGPCMGVS